MRDLLNFLQKVQEVNSTKVKHALLKEYLSKDDTFLNVFTLALNPFVMFYIKEVDLIDDLKDKNQSNELAMQELGDLLGKLHTREVTGLSAKTLMNEYFVRNGLSFFEVFLLVVRKDLRCGVGITLMNKVLKELNQPLIPTFDCMLAHKYDVKRIKKWPVRAELKLDGVRCIVRINENNDVEFLSRNGFRFTSVDHLAPSVLNYIHQIPDRPLYLDGELISGDSHFNVTVSEIKKQNYKANHAELVVFEILTSSEFRGESSVNLNTRMERLPDFYFRNVRSTEYHIVDSDLEVQKLFESALQNGQEGIIVKPLEGIYEPKRSYSWMKLKAEETLDLEITGVFEGEGKYEGKLGGFIVDNEGIPVRVGTGLTDAQREEWWKNPPIGNIATVGYHEVTPDGSLRHPRFEQLREDKQ